MAHANFLLKFSVGWKLMWHALILNTRISIGSNKLMWPIVIGLFSIVSKMLFDTLQSPSTAFYPRVCPSFGNIDLNILAVLKFYFWE